MAEHFKCLAKINGNKYSIIVDKISYKQEVRFKEVYKKIQQIDTNLDITFETYLFEVLDKDFDDYVVITNENQVIENLARFRVTKKSYKSPPKEDNKCKPNHEIKGKSGSKRRHLSIECNKTQEKFQCNQMNDLYINLMDNLDIPRLTKNDLKEFKDLRYFLELNQKLFYDNPENSGNWTRIANKMKSRGYTGDKFKPKSLKDLFNRYILIYEQVLEYCPDAKTATKYFMLFEVINSMSLRPFFPKTTIKRIGLLKEKFRLKEKNSLSGGDRSTPPAKVQKTSHSETKQQNDTKAQERKTFERKTPELPAKPISRNSYSNPYLNSSKTSPNRQSLPPYIPLCSQSTKYPLGTNKLLGSQRAPLKSEIKTEIKIKTEVPVIELD